MTSVSANRVLTTLASIRHVAYYFLQGPGVGVVYSLSLLFALYLFRAITGRDWAARALLFLWACVPGLVGTDLSALDFLETAIFAALIVAALTRFGLRTSAAQLTVVGTLTRVPLTLDSSAWYFGRSSAVLGCLALLLLASAYRSLGGKPIFGKALLDD